VKKYSVVHGVTLDNLFPGEMEGSKLLAGAAKAATYNMALQVGLT